MTELQHKIFIAAPPGAVWDALADLRSVQRYNPLVATVTILDGPATGPGAARRCDGPQGAFVERVTSWDPGHSLTIDLAESGWPVRRMRWTTSVRADAGGTLVTQTTTYEPKLGLLGAALDRLVLRRKLDAGIRDVFRRFKSYVEEGGREGIAAAETARAA